MFKDETFDYDGKTHSLQATNVPEGLTVTYTNNDQKDAGRYDVTAHFTFKNEADNNNYTLNDLKAVMTIQKTASTTDTGVKTKTRLFVSLFVISGILIYMIRRKRLNQ